MRKFNVNVNGTSYEVEVEELNGAPAAAATHAAAPAAAPKAAAPVNAAGTKINSPMPGNILDVKVKAGDAVKAGDTLLILEAMKMENEILAPSAGKVVAVHVNKGATVNSGDLLVTIA